MISVIIPVYNQEDSLHICLNSVLKQTYQNFEVICIDDASTDSSLDILKYFSMKDSRIKVLKNDFKIGLGYSKNRGLEEADGNYVVFLDGGDWFDFNAFDLLVNNIKKNNSDVLLFKSTISDGQGIFSFKEFENIVFSKFKNGYFNHFDLKKTELFELEKNISNQFYLKSFLDENKINFQNEDRINENIPFVYKVITSANKISSIDDRLINIHKKISDLSNSNLERLFDCFDIVHSIIEVFLDNNQLYNYYKKELLNHIFKWLYEKYCGVDNQVKERFFYEVQNVFKVLLKDYSLHEDISMHVDKKILDFFKFDEIIRMINNPPKMSIILPVYNTERDLPNVLESIVHQTIGFENIELIIIDDCSTDGSGEIIENYSKKYENVFPIFLFENSGSPSKPRNIGIRNATSDYIMFHDSDDCFELDSCEYLYKYTVDEDVDFVSGMITRNDNDIENFELAISPWHFIINEYDEFKDKEINELLSSDELFKLKVNSFKENKYILADYSLNSKLLKRSLFTENNIKFLEYLNGAEDSVVLFNLLIKTKSFIFINKVVFGYNVHRPDSLTHNFSLKTIQTRPRAYKLMYDIAVSNNVKDLFIELLLWRKLNYWVNHHLIKAPDLYFEDILLIFKSYQNLFSECYSFPDIPNFLKDICKDIKEGFFDDAVNKIIEKRLEYFESFKE